MRSRAEVEGDGDGARSEAISSDVVDSNAGEAGYAGLTAK